MEWESENALVHNVKTEDSAVFKDAVMSGKKPSHDNLRKHSNKHKQSRNDKPNGKVKGDQSSAGKPKNVVQSQKNHQHQHIKFESP